MYKTKCAKCALSLEKCATRKYKNKCATLKVYNLMKSGQLYFYCVPNIIAAAATAVAVMHYRVVDLPTYSGPPT